MKARHFSSYLGQLFNVKDAGTDNRRRTEKSKRKSHLDTVPVKPAAKSRQSVGSRLACVFAGFLLTVQPLMVAAQAQSVDLGSQSRTTAAPSSGVIIVGGHARPVQSGDMLTNAEAAALNQVVNGGRQAVNINALGAATGGRVNIGSDFGNNLTGLVIPQGVTAIGDFAKFAGMNLTGNLVNSGALYAYSTSAATAAANINANTILNNAGAVLGSVLPSSLGITNNIAHLDLNLTAVNEIINAGTINSSRNLNIVTNHLANSGTMQAQNNINVAPHTSKDLVVSGGGNYVSSQLNMTAPGTIQASLGNVTGVLNQTAEAAHVLAQSDTLKLGTIKMDGDPTYYNIGNISINGDITVAEKLAILSSGNITSTAAATQITARDGTGQGFDIQIVAGANLSPACGTCYPTLSGSPASSGTVTVTPTGGAGGNIDFSASPNLQINSSSTGTNQNGGNVTLAAFANGATGGTINLPMNSAINAGGSGTGSNGNVTVIAGQNTAGVTAIQLGAINTNSGSGVANGNVGISVATPTTDNTNPITFNSNGNVTTGNTIVAGATQNGAINLNGNINAKNTVTVTAGGNVTTPANILTTIGGFSGPHGSAVSPDGTKAWVTNAAANTVSQIDTATNTITATVSTGAQPLNVATNPAGTRLYVSNRAGASVSVYDITGASPVLVTTIGLTDLGAELQVTPDGSKLVVGIQGGPAGSGRVQIINTATNTVTATITPPGATVIGIGVSADGRFAYSANGIGGTVSTIDLNTNTVVATYSGGSSSNSGLVVSPNGQYIYVSNIGGAASNTVSVIRTSDNSIVASIPVGSFPTSLSINPQGTLVYCANGPAGSGSISIIDTGLNSVVQTVTTPNGTRLTNEQSVGIVGGNVTAYTANNSAGSVSAVRTANIGGTTANITSTGGLVNVNTNATNVTFSSSTSTSVTGLGNLNVGASTAGASANVGTMGNLNVNGVLTAGGNTNLQAGYNSNGSIGLNANISVPAASTAVIAPNGTGTITSTGGTVSVGGLILNTRADIGTPANPISIDIGAGGLTLNTTGSAYISDPNALIVNSATVGGDIKLKAAGTVTVKGDIIADPITILSGTNIDIQNDLIAPGGILLVASGDIFTSTNGGSQIKSSEVGANAGATTIIAGANFTDLGAAGVRIDANTNSGNINLDNGFPISTLSATALGAGNNNGGNITLVAYNGAGGKGSITLPAALTVQTGGGGSGNLGTDGKFVAIGGATAGSAVAMGFIQTKLTSTVGGGTITIESATPNSNSIVIDQGASTGNYSPANAFFSGAALTAGSISANGLNTEAASATVRSNAAISTGAVNTNSSFGATGGAITLEGSGVTTNALDSNGSSGGAINILTGTGGFTLGGHIFAIGSSGTGFGGSLTIETHDNNVLAIDTTANPIFLTANNAAGTGGTAILRAYGDGVANGGISLSGAGIFTQAFHGGSYTLDATGGSVDGPVSFVGAFTMNAAGCCPGFSNNGSITVSGTQINVGAGTLTLDAGNVASAGTGNVSVTGGLVSTGGNIAITAGNTIGLIGSGATVPGPGTINMTAGGVVNFTGNTVISANGGAGINNGSVTVSGSSITGTGSLTLSATGGNAGTGSATLTSTAGGITTPGNLQVSSLGLTTVTTTGTINTFAAQGGSVNFSGQRLNVNVGDVNTFSTGAGLTGGAVTIQLLAPITGTSSVAVGNINSQGTGASGSAGSVLMNLSADAASTLSVTSISANGNNTIGAGGAVTLSAGRVNTGFISVNGGTNGGNAGAVDIDAIGLASGSSTIGGISARGGSVSGNGGTVTIDFNAPLTPGAIPSLTGIDTGATSGTGGSITVINNGTGGLALLDGGTFNSSSGANGAAGDQSYGTVGGVGSEHLYLNGTLTIRADASAAFSQGRIFLFGPSIRNSTGGGTLTLSDSGGNGGFAQCIFIDTNIGSSDWFTNGQSIVGTGAQGFQFSIDSQVLNTSSATGAPGSVSFNVGNFLFSGGLNINTSATNGNTNGGNISITTLGAMDFGDLVSNGFGTGNGGDISVQRDRSDIALRIGGGGLEVRSITSVGGGGAGSRGGTATLTNHGGTVTPGLNAGISIDNNTFTLQGNGAGGGNLVLDATLNSGGLILIQHGTVLSTFGAAGTVNGNITMSGVGTTFTGGILPVVLNTAGGNAGTGNVTFNLTAGINTNFAGLTINSGNNVAFTTPSISTNGGIGGNLIVTAGGAIQSPLATPVNISSSAAAANTNAGNVSLTAGANLVNPIYVGNITAIGNGTGNGGDVTLSTASTSRILVGSNLGPFQFTQIARTITANGGNGGGAVGGTVTIRNDGTAASNGGMGLADSPITVTGANAAGGNITLDANGTFRGDVILGSFTGQVTSNLSTGGAAGTNNGNIFIEGANVFNCCNNPQNLNFDARGAGSNDGTGNVTIDVGGGAVSTITNAPVATRGDITITAGNNINITAGTVQTTSTIGNAGNLTMTAVNNITAATTGSIDASGGNFNAGNVLIQSVGNGTGAIVLGNVLLNATAAGRTAGAATITNAGTGGITLRGTVNAQGIAGSGNIVIDAGAGPVDGALTFTNSGVVRNDSGGVTGDVTVKASQVALNPGITLTMFSGGAASPNGNISITTTTGGIAGTGSSINFQANNGNLTLNLADDLINTSSATGSAGNVLLAAGLILDGSGTNINASTTFAGASQTGAVSINAGFKAGAVTGIQTGSINSITVTGGASTFAQQVFIFEQSTSPLVIGAGGGIQSITLHAGTSNGQVSLNAGQAAGIQIVGSPFTLTGLRSGSLFVSSPNGPVTFTGGTNINTSSTGAGNPDGTVTVQATNMVANGNLSITAHGTGSGGGNVSFTTSAGGIQTNGNSFTVDSSSNVSFSLSNGLITSSGGLVSLQGLGQFQPNSATINTTSAVGNGGNVTLNFASMLAMNQIIANGAAGFDGGDVSVTVATGSATPLSIGGGGLIASITSQGGGGAGSNGGTVSVTNDGNAVDNGGISILDNNTLNVTAPATGGGNIVLDAIGTTNGAIKFDAPAPPVTISTAGAVGFPNGNITMSADNIELLNLTGLNLLANTGGSGTGDILITTTGTNGIFSSGGSFNFSASHDVTISASQIAPRTGGSIGFVIVNAANKIDMTGVAVRVNGIVSGSPGSLAQLNAGNGGITVGSINTSGNGNAPGGNVSLSTNGGISVGNVDGFSINSSGGATGGTAGSVTINSFGSQGINIAGDIFARGTAAPFNNASGNNVTITASSPSGTPLVVHNIDTSSTVVIGSGDAGNISVTNTGNGVSNGGISIIGQLIATATAGNGGNVIVDAVDTTSGAVSISHPTLAGILTTTASATKNAGTITVDATDLQLNAATLNITSGLIGNTGSGNVAITTTVGDIISTSSTNITFGARNDLTLSIVGGDITTTTAPFSANVQLSAGGDVLAGSTKITTATVGVASSGRVFITSGADADGALVQVGDIDTSSGGGAAGDIKITTEVTPAAFTIGAGGNVGSLNASGALGDGTIVVAPGSGNGNLNINSPVTGGIVSLWGSNIANNSSITGSALVALSNPSLAGSLSLSGAGSFSFPKDLRLYAGGNIDLSGLSGGTITTGNFLAVAGGNITSPGGTVTIDASGASGGQVALIAGANSVFQDTLFPTTFDVTGLGGSGSIDFSANLININANGTAGAGGQVTFIAAGGNINAPNSISATGTTVGGTMLAIGSGDVRFGNTDVGSGTITIASAIPQFDATGFVEYSNAARTLGNYAAGAGSTGNILQSNGSFTAGTLNLSSGTGNINNGTSIAVDTTNLTVNTGGNFVAITNSNTGTLNVGPSSGGAFFISTQGPMTTTGNITATSLLTLDTTYLTNANTIQGPTVQISNQQASGFTVDNSGSIIATDPFGGLFLYTAPGQDLTVTGGGSLQATGGGTIYLVATDNGSGGSNQVIFSGNQNFFGDTDIRASGPNQSVWVQAPATVIGANAVVVHTDLLILDGVLQGNPLMLDSNFGGGTIANSVGNVTLPSNLVFNGQDLAIISVGSIVGSGITTIDLRGPNGVTGTNNGGSLTMAAGFNFTPATAGQVQDATEYTIGTPSAGGSINLGGVTILTGSAAAGGNGGSVTAVANGGSINIGSINTGAFDIGGAVTLIGQNGVSVGAITTTGGTSSGAVTIHSAQPTTTGTTKIADGIVLQGGFTTAPGTFGGNIVLSGNINTGTGLIDIRTGDTGSIRQSAVGINMTASDVFIVGGSGGIGSAAIPIRFTAPSSAANADGNVFLFSAAATGLNSSSGNTFNITSNGSLTIAGTLSAENITLQTLNNGNVAFTSLVPIKGQFDGDATNTTINANGSGSISQATSTLLQTGSLTLVSGTGDIGSLLTPIETNAAVVSANTGSTSAFGGAFLTDDYFGAVTMNASGSGTGSTFSYNGGASNLTINGIGSVGAAPNISVSNTSGNTTVSAPIIGTGVTLGAGGNLTVSASIDSLTGNGLYIATNTITVNNPVSGNRVTFLTTPGFNGSVSINAPITATGSTLPGIKIQADGSGNISQNGGTLSAVNSSIVLSTGSGNIGNIVGSIVFDSPKVTAGTTGNVFLNALNATTSVNGSGNSFQMTSSGNIIVVDDGVVNGISANNVTLSTTNNGNIAFNAIINGIGGPTTNATSIMANANGIGTLQDNLSLLTPTLRTQTLSLSSGSGDIGTPAARIKTNALTVLVDTTGKVYVADTNNNRVTLNATAGPVLDVTFAGSAKLGGAIAADDIDLDLVGDLQVTANIFAANSAALTANAGITQTAFTVISTPQLALASSSGNIGTLAQMIQTDAATLSINSAPLNTTGSAYVNSTSPIALGASSGNLVKITSGGSITVNGVLSINNLTLASGNGGDIVLNRAIGGASGPIAITVALDANGAGNILNPGGFQIDTAALTMTSGSGNMGTDTEEIATSATSISANTLGGVFIDQVGGNVTVTGSGDTFEFAANGPGTSVTVGAGGVSARDLLLAATTTISNVGPITATDLRVAFGLASTSTLTGNIQTLQSDFGGTLNFTNTGNGLILRDNLLSTGLNVSTPGTLTVQNGISGLTNLTLTSTTGKVVLSGLSTATNQVISAADTIIQTFGKISGSTLDLTFANGPVVLVTAVNSFTTNAPGQTLVIVEDDGVTVGNQVLSDLFVSAGNTASGTLATGTNLTLNSIVFDNVQGTVQINHNLDANIMSLVAENGTLQGNGTITGGNVVLNGTAINLPSLITADVLNVGAGSSNATFHTNAGSIQTTSGGSLTFNQDSSVTVLDQQASSVTFNVANGDLVIGADISVTNFTGTAPLGTIDLSGNVNGGSTVTLVAPTIVGSRLVSGGALTVGFGNANSVTLNTDVASLTTTSGGTLTIIENSGITLNAQGIARLNLDVDGDINVSTGINADLDFLTTGAINSPFPLSGTTGAFNASSLNITGKVSFSDLSVTFSNAGTASLTTNVGTLTTGGGGTLNIVEDNNIALGAQAVSSLNVTSGTVSGGAVTISAPFTVNTLSIGSPTTISIDQNITATTSAVLSAAGGGGGAGKISGGALTVDGSATYNTAVSSLTTTGGGTVVINEDNGITLLGQAANDLTVNAGRVGAGDLVVGAPMTVPTSVKLTQGLGDISVDNDITLGAGSSIEFQCCGASPVTTQKLKGGGNVSATSIKVNVPSGAITGKISATNLDATFGAASTVTLNTNVTNFTSSGGGTITINEDDGITLNAPQGIGTLTVNAGRVAAGDVNGDGIWTVGTLNIDNDNGGLIVNGTITVTGNETIDVTFGSGLGKTDVQDIQVRFAPLSTSTLNLNVHGTLTSLSGGTFTVNEDDGLTLGSQGVDSLIVHAGTVSHGGVTVGATINVADLNLDGDMDLHINNPINATSVTLNPQGTIDGNGKITATDLFVGFSSTSAVTLKTNVTNLTVTGGGTLHVDEDSGITIAAVTALNNLEIDAGLVSNGTLSVTPALTMNSVDLNNAGGDVSVGNITANTITLIASNTINSSGTLSGGALTVGTGSAASITLTTNVDSFSTTSGGIVVVNETDGISLLAQNVDDLTVNAGGNISVDNAFFISKVNLNSTAGNLDLNDDIQGTTSVDLSATGTISQASGKYIYGGALTIGQFTGTAILTTAVASLRTTNAAGSSLIINEDNGIVLLGQNLSNLTVNAAQVSSGLVSLGANVTVTNNLTINLANTGNIQTGAFTITAPNLSISLLSDAILTTNVGTFTASTNGFIDMNEADGITLNAVSAEAFDLVAGPSVTINDDISVNDNFSLIFLAPALSSPTLTVNDDLTANSVSITSPSTLTIGGNGTINGIVSAAVSSVGQFIFSPGTQVVFGGPTILNSPVSISLNNGVVVTGLQVLNVQTPVFNFNGGTITGNPLIFSNAGGNGGTIANSAGDLVLTGNLIFPGQDLTLLSSGSVIANAKTTKIDLSSKTGAGGNLTIIAGYDFTGTDSTTPNNGTYDILAESGTGGNIFLAKTAINTGTTFTGTATGGPGTAAGGSILAVAHGGTVSAGTIYLGAINTSATNAAGVGGGVRLIGQGGVQTGAITTKGPTAGPVLVDGAEPVLFSNVQIKAGAISNGTFLSAGAAIGQGAGILVNGSITSSGTVGRGGNVVLSSDAQIEIVGGIIATGASSPIASVSAGGNVDITSLTMKVTTGTAGINTSGVKVTRATRAGDAGDINIFGGGTISVGTMLAKGGDNAGTGGGGAGGAVTLQTKTITVGSDDVANGPIKVTGFIDARGGAAAKTGGSGGAGGSVFIDGSTLVITAANAGASVNTSGGLGAIGGNGTNGAIEINTYAIQNLPSNLDLTSIKKTIAVLPGGMFSVGAAAPVNGVAGNIVSGATILGKTFNGNGQIVDGAGFNFGQVSVNANGVAVPITEGGNSVTYSIVSGGKRVLVTPGEALALFDTSAGFSQGVVLGSDGTATGGTIGIPALDINSVAFTAFNLPTGVQLDISGDRPVVTMPKTFVWNGTVNFTEAGGIGYINYGTASPVINGALTSVGNSVVLSGTGAAITNNGTINVDELVLARPGATAVKFTTGALAATTGTRILLGKENVGYSFTFNATGAQLGGAGGGPNMPVEFGIFRLPAIYRADATGSAANVNLQKTVALNFGLSENNAGNLNAVSGNVGGTTTFTVRSTVSGCKVITIKGTASNFAGFTTQSGLNVIDNTGLSSFTNLTLSSTSGVTVGDGVTLAAGTLKSTAPDFNSATLLAKTDVQSAGSIIITSSGIAGITIGDGSQLISNGGNLTATASATGGNISIGDGNTFRAMGGNVVILAKGIVTGNDSNNFEAKGFVNSTTGGIEVGSGLTAGTLAKGFSSASGTRPTSPAFTGATFVGTGAVLANITGNGSVDLGATSNSTLTLNGGAMVFDAVGTGSSVTFNSTNNFTTKGSKPVAFNSLVAPEAEEFVVDTGDDEYDTFIVQR